MNAQKTLNSRAWAELILLGTIWGGSFFAISIALEEIGPLTSVLHRTLWAALVLWLFALLSGYRPPKDIKIWGAFLVMGILNNLIPFGLMAWGQLHIETGLVSILNATTAIFGVIVAALFFADERLTLRKGIGVLVGFGGVATAIGLEHFRHFNLQSLAQLAILAGTMSYAVAGVWARKFLGHLPPQLAAAGMLTGSSVISFLLAYWVEGPPTLDLAPRTWMGIGYYSIVATAGAYLLYYRVLAMAGSGNLMLVTLLIPPVAITLGAVFLGEKLGPNAFTGFGLLVLGLLILDGRLFRRARIDRGHSPG